MKKIVIGLLLVGLSSSAWAVKAVPTQQAAETTESGNAAATLSSLLQNYRTYQANFSQTTFGGKGKGGHSQGRVYIQRPGRFRWETSSPYEQVLVASGGQLWIYDKDLKQASQQPMGKGGFNPGELLTEPVSDLSQRYIVTQDSSGWFKLMARQPSRGFKLAFLKFEGGQLVGLKILNQLNQTNVFTFSGVRVNQPLSPSLFSFKPPAGVQVLKGNPSPKGNNPSRK